MGVASRNNGGRQAVQEHDGYGWCELGFVGQKGGLAVTRVWATCIGANKV